MLHLLANPGTFYQTMTPDALQALSNSCGALVFAFCFTPISIIFIFAAFDGRLKKTRKNIVLVGLLFIATVVGLIASTLWVVHEVNQNESQKAKYYTSVTSWLDTGYGIKTNTEIAQRLLRGETFAVTHHGQEITVAVTEKINGDLAVVDQNNTVLKPAE